MKTQVQVVNFRVRKLIRFENLH